MLFLVEDICRDVRIALDENMSSKNLADLGDVDTLSLDDIVDRSIITSTHFVEGIAPLHTLEDLSRIDGNISWSSQMVGIGSGSIVLPIDFARLVSFQMSDWAMPVSHITKPTDPIYPKIKCRYAGIGASPQRPAVVISHQAIGRVLEFYSCSEGDSVYIKRGQYLPIREVKNESINISQSLRDAVVYHAAGSVAMIIGHAEESGRLLGYATELIKAYEVK